MELSRRLGRSRAEASLTGNLGLAYQRTGPLIEAVHCSRRALELFEALDLPDDEGSGLCEVIAQVRRDTGRYAEAREQALRALDLAARSSDELDYASCAVLLASIDCGAASYQAAREGFERAAIGGGEREC